MQVPRPVYSIEPMMAAADSDPVRTATGFLSRPLSPVSLCLALQRFRVRIVLLRELALVRAADDLGAARLLANTENQCATFEQPVHDVHIALHAVVDHLRTILTEHNEDWRFPMSDIRRHLNEGLLPVVHDANRPHILITTLNPVIEIQAVHRVHRCDLRFRFLLPALLLLCELEFPLGRLILWVRE